MHVSTRTAPSSSITLIQIGGDPALDTIIVEAAYRAFGGAAVAKIPRLDSVPEEVDPTLSLLLLAQPEDALVEHAAGMLGTDRLPRWGVVVFGPPKPTDHANRYVEYVAPEDWNAAVVTRVLRSASIQQALRRENAQLREDFATYGQRIAHDLRTPLGGVLTSTEMLKEVLSDESPANAAFTGPILDSAEGLVKLIDRISFLAKANAQRDASELLDMGTVFWNAFQKMESQILKAGAGLTQAQSWPKVRGHGSSLETVWRNLISNALVHGGLAVRIEAGWDPVAGGHRFWLASNSGIPAEKRGTLFFPFHRLHEPGAPRGLGLPTVRRLVELDGGHCGFEETPGGGSRFFFVLPDV